MTTPSHWSSKMSNINLLIFWETQQMNREINDFNIPMKILYYYTNLVNYYSIFHYMLPPKHMNMQITYSL